MPSIPRDRQWQFRFLVITPTREVNLTSYLTSARFTLGDVSRVGAGAAGSDGMSVVADFTLANDRPNSDALQPSVPESSWNKALDGTTPELLLFPYRRVRFEARWRVPGGAWPAWGVLFDGFLGDSIDTNARASTVGLRARDRAKRLMDKYLDTLDAFGAPEGTLVPTVMQALIDSELSPSETLHVVGSPTFMVGAYSPLRVTLWDAIQELAMQMGWFLGYRKDAVSGEFELTLLDPPREKTTPDYVFDAGDVRTADVKQSDRDVRNAVRIYYVDEASRERRAFPMAGPLIDSASVAALGGVEKLMVIEEGSTSQIDTEAQAEALAERALHDLSGLMGSTQVTLPFVPELQLFDLVGIDVPSQGVNEAYGVQSLQHTLDFSNGFKASTMFTGTNKVTGKRKQWLDRELSPGSPAGPDPNAVRLLAPGVFVEMVAGGGFAVVTNTGRSRGVRAIGVEVHVSTTQGFTPSTSTLWARGPEGRFVYANVLMDSLYYVRARSYDGDGRYSEYTDEVDVQGGGLNNAVVIESGTTTLNGTAFSWNAAQTGTVLAPVFYRTTYSFPVIRTDPALPSVNNVNIPAGRKWTTLITDVSIDPTGGTPFPSGVNLQSVTKPVNPIQFALSFPMNFWAVEPVNGPQSGSEPSRWMLGGRYGPNGEHVGEFQVQLNNPGSSGSRTPQMTFTWRLVESDA